MTDWIDVAGWTLLHFVWQGAVVWGVAAPVLRSLTTAQARHATACIALLAMLTVPLMTAFVLTDRGAALVPLLRSTIATLDAPQLASEPPTAPSSAPAATTDGATRADASIDRRSMMPFVVTFWLSGVALLLGRLVGACWRVRRLRLTALGEPVSQWQEAAEAIARRLRLARQILVVDSARVDTPTVIGWLRPVVVLPVAAMSNLAPSQVEAILAHEIAHIRRHDFLVNVLQTVAETLLFYHPAVWWISRRIRAEREHCCDDVAVDVCGDPVSYAEALTELAAWAVDRPPLVLAATNGSLLARVRRLLRVSPETDARTSSRLLVAGLAAVFVLVVGTVRAITVAQSSETGTGTGNDRALSPPETINRFVGFELLPGRRPWPPGDRIGARAWSVTIRYTNGEMPLMGFTARSLIRHAYDAHDLSILDAPRWLDEETFDLSIDADVPVAAGVADPDGLNTTIRELMEQRLGLVVHREQRELPVYALVMADRDGRLGPNIALSTADCWEATSRPRTRAQQMCGIEDTLTGINAQGVALSQLAAQMRPGMPLAPDLPVVDRTGLGGKYDFRIRFGFLPLAAVGAHHPAFGALIRPFGFHSLFSALPEQLGLTLEKTTAPIDVLVIDHIQRP